MTAKFLLSKSKLLEQYNLLKSQDLSISYSYKTNREVGNLLQTLVPECEFSIHNIDEIQLIKNKSKIWFFTQANSKEEIKEILNQGVSNFVIDNESDLQILLSSITNQKINLALRMKFNEHRIGSGRYYVYGMPSNKINDLVSQLKPRDCINQLGIHIHRKSQNTTEWNISSELQDSLSESSLQTISFINLGGGLPVKYKTHSADVMPYILEQIKLTQDFLSKHNIKCHIEPGRFLAAPAIKLQAQVIQIHDNTLVLDCSIYNSALDTIITSIRLLVENELPENEGKSYLIKGNTPARDDIFRYKACLPKTKIGDTITFLNAGAYNYKTDFCHVQKLPTEIVP
ncbi:decarboxylase [Candidatus Pacearchaeota archaeon]|nr:decarboxylase [Candidatus Pacearchaeota archaeon]|tara:strand:+ start:182 stop:1210 length:1029 start_codon:yes stop_codon:yes gene_type:complete